MVDRVTEEIHERLERELRILESDYQRTIEAEPARTAVNGNGRAAPASGADDDSTTSEADESEAVPVGYSLLGDNDSSDSDNPEEIHAVNFSDVSAAQNLMGGECDEDSDSGGRLSDRRAAISRASAAGQLNAPGTGDRAQERQQDRITMSTEDAASIRMAMDGFELPAPSWARELDNATLLSHVGAVLQQHGIQRTAE